MWDRKGVQALLTFSGRYGASSKRRFPVKLLMHDV